MTKRGLVHHGIAWLLSAALLLTNGLPISVEHAHHISGDLAHHQHGSQPAPSQTLAAIDDVTDHLHVLWFGWEFAVPASQDQSPGTHAATSIELLARLETLGDSQAGAAKDACAGLHASSDVAMHRAAFDPVCRDSGAHCFVRAASQAQPLAALPLCDVARHARSGVQLA